MSVANKSVLPSISVIVCTHNPREDYLNTTLAALRMQSLDLNQWEFLIVDNASSTPVTTKFDCSWHPHSNCFRENNVGLTHARLCGIHNSRADLLVFVDDDNLLAPNYLQECVNIAESHPFIGAWGGSLVGQFEQDPPEWAVPYVHMLAVRTVTRDSWSNIPKGMTTCPAGAGMAIRKEVALKYARILETDSRRSDLDRKGKSLVSCGDMDMAYSSCDIGLGIGLFTSLTLQHLIPSFRLEKSYLLRLCEANGYSTTILNNCRGEPLVPGGGRKSMIRKILSTLRFRTRHLTSSDPIAYEFDRAWAKGVNRAVFEILAKEDNVVQ